MRFSVTLSNGALLLPRDEGLWAQVRNGLSFSLRGLSLSLNFLIVGVLFVLPWLVLLGVMLWVVRRIWRPVVVQAAATIPTATPSATA